MPDPSQQPTRDLILTTAVGYDWGKLEPFFTSLRRTGCAAEIVVATTGFDDATERQLARAGGRSLRIWQLVQRIPPRWAWVRFHHRRLGWLRKGYAPVIDKLPLPKGLRLDLAARIGCGFHGVMCSRFLWYYLYLRKHGRRYRRVIISDARDVYFQADPFAWDPGQRLAAILEDNAFLGSEPANTRWLQAAFGDKALEKAMGRQVCCAGVTLGTVAAVRDYCAVMTDLLARFGWRFPGENYIDQGVHNYAIRFRLADRLDFHRNFEGPVLTMHTLDPSQIRPDPEGLIRNRDGSIIPILHQYDRHPALAEKLLSRLRAPAAPPAAAKPA